MGQRIQVEWQESAEELKQLYKQEQHPQRRTRLQALWHLRQSGIDEVYRRVTGYHSAGVPASLNRVQQRALVAKVELGLFRTVWDAVQWVEDRWSIHYSYQGMYALLKRHKLVIKVPRPHSEKADPQQQVAWKKGADAEPG